ncbi:MAG: DUF3987 domain-containing protein, partial [Beijerinckiaceae bacterium]
DSDAMLEMLTNSQPGSNGDNLRAEIGQFWDQSGEGLNLGAVRYSKAENSSAMVQSPSLTVGFDVQEDPFKRFLGHTHVISTGLAQRFIFITRLGPRVKGLKDLVRDVSEELVDHIAMIWAGVQASKGVAHVKWEPEARQAFHQMDDEIEEILMIPMGPQDDILNRSHLQAAKVAALLAVGINPHSPVITASLFLWAKGFVRRGYDICRKFIQGGEVGSGHRVRISLARAAITEYVKMPRERRSMTYKTPKSMEHLSSVIPERYFLIKLSSSPDFKGSDIGPSSEDLIRRTLQELVRQSALEEVTRQQVMEQHQAIIHANSKGPFYALGGEW